ncbi:MAG: outer membrane protein assembly factor BamA [bacterium]
MCLLLLSDAIGAQTVKTQQIIKEIQIQGNVKIEESTIRYQIKSKVGEKVDPHQIREDIKDIFNIGYFQDIQVEQQKYEDGVRLIFIVKEKPWIRDIEISGNKAFRPEKIKEQIDLKANSILDEASILQNIQKLIKFYKEGGFYLVNISYKTEPVAEGWEKLIISIEENKKLKIREISFHGNNSFSKKELLKQIKTKEAGVFSFLSGSGILNPDELEEDRFRLTNFYLDKGFINISVSSPTVSLKEDKTGLSVQFALDERGAYTVAKVDCTGNSLFDKKTIMDLIYLQEGEIFARSKVSFDITRITDLYGEHGYLLCNVHPDIEENREDKTINIIYKIDEGRASHLRWINIMGNVKTRDNVIRREILLDEGDILDTKRIRKSYRNINYLGFFEEVSIDPKPTDDESIFDLDVHITERLTGQIMVGAGYNTRDNLMGTAEIKIGNLMGRGQTLSISGEVGGERQTYNIGFTEPWIFNKPISFGFNVYDESKSYEYTDYSNQDIRGGDLKISFPVTDYTRFYTTYSLEKVHTEYDPNFIINRDNWTTKSLVDTDYELYRYQDANGNVLFYQRPEEKSLVSSLIFTLSRDSRDNKYRPTDGSLNKISYKIAGGVLQGDEDFYKIYADSGWHLPLPWYKFTLSFHTGLAYGDGFSGGKLPDKFYCGGDTTVRGYGYGEIKPRDEVSDIVNKRAVFNLELHFPLVEAIAGLFFLDAGAVYSVKEDFFSYPLRLGGGIGIRFFTPMGPIRLDWGQKLLKKPNETYADWHFSIGTYF